MRPLLAEANRPASGPDLGRARLLREGRHAFRGVTFDGVLSARPYTALAAGRKVDIQAMLFTLRVKLRSRLPSQ